MTAVEVITSVERRRQWRREDKLRIVAESAEPGRTSSQVARRYGLSPGQLFTWRRQLLAEAIANSVGGDGFVPVEVAKEPTTAALPATSAPAGDRAIEIRLPNGIVIGVSETVAVEPLRRVLAALSGR
jgi:transposase-like protein